LFGSDLTNTAPVVESDHDLLVRIDERVASVLKWVENHDRRHARIISALLATIAASIAAMAGALGSWLLR